MLLVYMQYIELKQVLYSFRKLAWPLACVLLPLDALAAPLLTCKIDQGGSRQVFEFSPVSDPYPVQAIDINGRFRFKAVVVGEAGRIEYVKLYTYDLPSRKPVLLHEAKYLAPPSSAILSPTTLTGVNYIYSPRLEREIQYECDLKEVAP